MFGAHRFHLGAKGSQVLPLRDDGGEAPWIVDDELTDHVTVSIDETIVIHKTGRSQLVRDQC